MTHRRITLALVLCLAGCASLAESDRTAVRGSTATAPGLTRAQAALVADVAGQDRVMDLRDARHLATRTGFGFDPDTVARWVGQRRHAAVDALLSSLRTEPISPVPAWTHDFKPRLWEQTGYSQAEQQAFNRARSREIADLRRWWIDEIVRTPSPLTEKLTLFWHDHFVSSFEGTGRWSHALFDQNRLFRQHGAANYRDLLRRMVRDPALLVYLDNTSNQVGAPNENFAREFLELFTLGDGHYTEADVRASARALAGWGVRAQANYRFDLKHWAVDPGEKTVFDRRGRFDADNLIDIVLEHPEASTFLTRKLWARFISSLHQDPAAIAAIGDVFRRSGWDLRTLYTALFKSDAFWADAHRGTLAKTPADLVLGLARTFDRNGYQADREAHRLRLLGQELFQHANVSGWPKGLDWLTPALLAKRALLIREWLGERGVGATRPATTPVANNMMMAADNGALTVRVAGEAFDGAPRYRVLVHTASGDWPLDLGTATVPFSHDTALYGSVDDVESELTWTQQAFELPRTESAITRVEIAFENDATHPNGAAHGDRNLYVAWVDVAERRLDANRGTKTGCGPNQPAAMWCTGRLSLALADTALPDLTQPIGDAHDLVVEDIYFHWWDDPDGFTERDWVQFTLYRPRFKGRTWRNLSIGLVRSPAVGGRGLLITEGNCHPDCLARWPAEHWTHGTTQERSIVLGTRPHDGQFAAHLSGLDPDDLELLTAVLRHTPAIRDALARDRLDRTPAEQAALATWLDEFDQFSQDLQLGGLPDTLGTLLTENRHGAVAARGPEDRTGQHERDWQPGVTDPLRDLAAWHRTLPAPLAETPLTTLLLAAPPVSIGETSTDLGAILQDLAFQVH